MVDVSEAVIRRRVGELGEWFHNLDLGGVPTAPNHFLGDFPANKWRRLGPFLPADLAGASVLDVGCNAGYYSFALKRRGAGRVLGVDVDLRYLAQARFAAEVYGLPVEFRHLSAYQLEELREQFDYVLFMGLFYHLRYPVLALDLAVTRTRPEHGRLVFQTMARGEPVRQAPEADYDFWDPRPFQQPGFPRMTFIEHSFAGDPTNWWIPNPAAAAGLLRSAGLRIVAQPEAEIWICELTPEAARQPEPVWRREWAGTL
ncbi:MAG: TIGR04290 family methyltransferase [Terriglobales bacterium]